MKKTISDIQHILSTRWATLAILFIAIASRITHLIFFFNIRVDRSYQLLATQNFVHGNGISTASVLSTDLSTITYTPLIKWPPGYSLLLSPFYSITGNNYLLSSLFLDIAFGIILIFVARAILKLLDTPLFLINIYTVISSLFIYYFYFITSSDGIAATLFLIALYFTLAFIKNKLNLSKGVLLISLFLFGCAFMKYLFMPAVFVVPLYLVWKGFIDKKKIQLRAGLLSGLIVAIGLIAVLFYQKSISGDSVYVSDAPNGFFAENLLSAYPLVPAAIVKPDTIGLMLNSSTSESQVLTIFRIIYFISLVLVVVWLITRFIKTKFKNPALTTDYFYLTAGISMATILLLAALSIRVAKAEDMPGNWWTFIQEPRYYGLPNVLIHIAIFAFYQAYKIKSDKITKIIFCFLLASLLPELFRGAIFTAKRVANFSKEEYSWQSDLKIQQYADAIINKEKGKHSLKKAIVTGTSYYFNNRISLYSHIPILHETDKINNPALLQRKENVLLLVVLDESSFSKLNSLLIEKNYTFAGQFQNLYFYTINLSTNITHKELLLSY